MNAYRFLPALAGTLLLGALADQPAHDYEVWAADQNENALYVLDPEGQVLRVLDGETLGNAGRPHMLWGIAPDPFVYSANTVSDSVTVLDGMSGQVVAVVEGVGKMPHAAQPNPARPQHIYVANIGPQGADEHGNADMGETIVEIIRHAGDHGFTWEIERSLDLAAQPELADDALFPSRRPVCAGFSPDGRFMLVTLFNGGLVVIDVDQWQIAGAWGADQIAPHGCGFADSPLSDEIYVTAGGMHASWLYVFEFTPAGPQLVASHDLSDAGQDAHGVWVDADARELWVIHRVSDNATIHPLDSIRNADHDFEVMEFVGRTPDLIVMSPDYTTAFITLRGPKPAPTIPHDIVGEKSGIAIVDVAAREIIRIVHPGDPTEGDFHGIYIPYGLEAIAAH